MVIRPGWEHRDAVRRTRGQIGSAEVPYSPYSGPATTRLMIISWGRRGQMRRSVGAHWPRWFRTGWWWPWEPDGHCQASVVESEFLCAWRRSGACIARPTREGYRVVCRPRRTPRGACLGGAKREENWVPRHL